MIGSITYNITCFLDFVHAFPPICKNGVLHIGSQKAKFAHLRATNLKNSQKLKRESPLRTFPWSEWRDLNPRPHGPEPCALPTALHPDSYIIIVVLPVSVKGGVWPFLGKTGSGKRKSPTEVGLFESTITCCTERRYPWRS